MYCQQCFLLFAVMSSRGRSSVSYSQEDSSAANWVPPAARAAGSQSIAQRNTMPSTPSTQAHSTMAPSAAAGAATVSSGPVTRKVFLWRPGEGSSLTPKVVLPEHTTRATQPPLAQAPMSSVSSRPRAAGMHPLNDLNPSAATRPVAAKPEVCLQCGELERRLQAQREQSDRERQQLSVSTCAETSCCALGTCTV